MRRQLTKWAMTGMAIVCVAFIHEHRADFLSSRTPRPAPA
jgi:hypothetical protein